MQPPRRKTLDTTEHIDRAADWLLTHCPLSALTLLTALVCAWPADRRVAWLILAVAALGDVLINLVRWRRRRSRRAHAEPVAPPRVLA